MNPSPIISIRALCKTYAGGFEALKQVDLDIERGEIIALLGPNGAGKTTLISIVCGIVRATSGTVTVAGYDTLREFRKTRAMIGLVPQELTTDAFESVANTLAFSRGLFGKPAAPEVVEKVLRSLTLWDKKDSQIMTLSGGMKRRLLIAKALAHEPDILFLDEPTAGVDVSLRKDMWQIIRDLQAKGVTIILTTHYIDEAEEVADRIGIIDNGELMLVEGKRSLMATLGKKRLVLDLVEPLAAVPAALAGHGLEVNAGGTQLVYTFACRPAGAGEDDPGEPDSAAAERTGITSLLDDLREQGICFRDLHTTQSSLEDIFVDLVGKRAGAGS